MKFIELLEIVKNTPAIRSQISRWVREGKVIMLRRGCYTIAPPYSGGVPSIFVLANAMKPASYISCQSALA